MSYDRAMTVENCRSKLWFESEAEANGAAEQISVRRGSKLWSYECPICRLFHLTSRAYSPNQARKAKSMEEKWQQYARRKPAQA